MEREDHESGVDNISVDPSTSSVNNLILDYYKKFGRKRDLEQFFSLSTAQTEIRDPTGNFWRNMKSQNDSSESGEKKSESSAELCRISIKCSVPEPSSFMKRAFEEHQNSDSESPPIVTEEVEPRTCGNSDEESIKSEDVHSQRSNDATLDTSMNKPPSPTSSITSQRKLEWDSLADVGYGNESDRKTSASSLSTLERLALNQQYSHNDSKLNMKLGPPTSHSTPVEQDEAKAKGKKGLIKKTTKIHQKDVDYVELNVPHNSQSNLPQAISVNLSKHICFNVEKDGGINIDNIKKDISVSPEKNAYTSKQTQEKQDKKIQTPILVNVDKNTNVKNKPADTLINTQKFPVVSLNSLKKRNRKNKFRKAKKNLRNRNKLKIDTENILKSKTTDEVSEAESFEYMPGHIYNQNHLKMKQSRETHVGNKSSLESSVGLTTDSSKGSKHSFSKDLEKSIDLMKAVLQQNNNDSTLKKRLIKEVVQRLIKSKYRDDESSTEFLSGLSFSSKIIGEANHTTSTSDTYDTRDKTKLPRPKKSILQTAKFDSNAIASTSQSVPNLPSVSNSEKRVSSNLTNPIFLSNTDTEMSSKEKKLTDVEMISSEVFYKKYLDALKREQAHKKHLQDKENFLKQKLGSSETAIAQLVQADLRTKSKLKNLIKDLTRNNYNDGSGDASNLEGHSYSNMHMDSHIMSNNQRSHSVFTLSSGHNDGQNKNPRLKNIITSAIHSSSKAGTSKNEHHYCCCPFHTDHAKVGFTDSSVQVNIECNKPKEKAGGENSLQTCMKCIKCKKESPRNIAKVVSDSETGDLKYICVCTDEAKSEKVAQNFLIYKCSRLINKSVQLGDSLTGSSSTENEQTKESYTCNKKNKKPKVTLKQDVSAINMPQHSKSSQTNVHLNLMMQRKSSVNSIGSQSSDSTNEVNIAECENDSPKLCIQEAIRSIQTDISINPKLSDPCLSDINIIDGNECVELVKEQYREVSKSNSEKNTEAHSSGQKSQVLSSNSSGKVTSKSSTENIHQSKKSLDYAYIAQLDKEIQSDLGLVEGTKNENFTDQFFIPIQGTNMTLKVNLGTTEAHNNQSSNIAKKSQGIATEKTDVSEQFTSLREDCTKSAQCCNANIFQQIQRDNTEQNISEKNMAKNEEPRNTTTYAVNACLVDSHKCNTYPKKDQGYTRKPLLRTNTDISKFETLNAQFDFKKLTEKQDFSNDGQETDRSKRSIEYQFEKKKNLIDPKAKINHQTLGEKCANSAIQDIKGNQITKAKNAYKPQQCAACSNQKDLADEPIIPINLNQPEKCTNCSNQKALLDQPKRPIIQNLPEKYTTSSNQKVLIDQPTFSRNVNQQQKCTSCSKQKDLLDQPIKPLVQTQTEKSDDFSNQKVLVDEPVKPIIKNQPEKCSTCSNKDDLLDYPRESVNQNQTAKSAGYSNQNANEPKKPIEENQLEMCTACSKQRDFIDQYTSLNNQRPSKNSTTSDRSESEQTKSRNQDDSKGFTTCTNGKHVIYQAIKSKQNLPTKCATCSNQKDLPDLSTKSNNLHQSEMFLSCSSKSLNLKSEAEASKATSKREKSLTESKASASESNNHPDSDGHSDLLLDMIEGITKRYTKKDIEKSKRKKCFKEIMNVLNYLLDTEEGSDDHSKLNPDLKKADNIPEKRSTEPECTPSKTFVDKGVQLSEQSKPNKCCTSESSEIAVTSEFPTTSSDSVTCKLLKKIKKECEKYHQRRCKSHNGLKARETSSTTSVSCEQCKRVHHCYCLRHKCKTHKTKTCSEKTKKKCIAYNLILQTSDSVVSEEPVQDMVRPLKSIIVKVPSKRKQPENVPFKEMAAKLERNLPNCSPRSHCKGYRSRSLPNESELSSNEEYLRKPQTYTVREYLQRNRPDFVVRSSRRQDCLKTINETRPEMCTSPYFKMVVVHTPKCVAGSCLDPCNVYGGMPMSCDQCVDPYTHIQNEVKRIAQERHSKRKLLSLQLAKQQTLSALTDEELRHFAKQLSEELRRKKVAPKFINEREMKKHSEKIYKSLPEVTRKKEELKKENIKKTNLLMANIFKKNLQKKTLGGSVNLSNYSTVIKI